MISQLGKFSIFDWPDWDNRIRVTCNETTHKPINQADLKKEVKAVDVFCQHYHEGHFGIYVIDLPDGDPQARKRVYDWLCDWFDVPAKER